MSTPRMTEQEWAEHQRRVRISKSKTGKGPGPARVGADSQAVAGPRKVSSTSPYRSKWEAAYASKLEMEKGAGLIKAWWYEPFSLWLPGKVRYKPDFMVQRNYLTNSYFDLEIIEVKGWSKNRRDGMTRLKIAAALFPCFTWTLVRKTKDGWEEEQP